MFFQVSKEKYYTEFSRITSNNSFPRCQNAEKGLKAKIMHLLVEYLDTEQKYSCSVPQPDGNYSSCKLCTADEHFSYNRAFKD